MTCVPTWSAAAGGKAADPLATGHYKVHLQHEATSQWYELHDLHVSETMPQMIGVSQAYFMIYKRQEGGGGGAAGGKGASSSSGSGAGAGTAKAGAGT
jgi:hypothetical protein